MFDVNHNAKETAGNSTSEVDDEPLLLACAEFFRLNEIWIEANPEKESQRSFTWGSEERWQAALKRDEVLHTIETLTPLGIAGAVEKYKVLEELVRWKGIEDELVAAFSLTLVRNYTLLFLDKYTDRLSVRHPLQGSRVSASGGEDKRIGRFSLHKIFGIFYN